MSKQARIVAMAIVAALFVLVACLCMGKSESNKPLPKSDYSTPGQHFILPPLPTPTPPATHQKKPTPRATPHVTRRPTHRPTPTRTVTQPTVREVTPGAFCSTSGSTGAHNGRTYTCKGPLPLRWRR